MSLACGRGTPCATRAFPYTHPASLSSSLLWFSLCCAFLLILIPLTQKMEGYYNFVRAWQTPKTKLDIFLISINSQVDIVMYVCRENDTLSTFKIICKR